jgi:hypothetical protein
LIVCACAALPNKAVASAIAETNPSARVMSSLQIPRY